MALDPQLEALLNEYEKPPVPGGNPSEQLNTTNPFAVKLGSQQYTFNSPQELQTVLDQSFANVGNHVRTLESRLQELENANQELAKNQAPPKPKNPENQPPLDPMEFASALANDPSGGIAKAVEKDPRIAEALLKNLPQFQELQQKMEFQQFEKEHPLYAQNPQVMAGLTQFVKANNLPVNARTLEMAAATAVSQGVLQHENVIRQQQQQAFLARLQQNQQPPNFQNQPNNQNQYGQFTNQQNYPPQLAQYPQYQQPLQAPPRVGGGSTGQQPSIEERVNRIFSDQNMTTQQMREMLSKLEQGNFMG